MCIIIRIFVIINSMSIFFTANTSIDSESYSTLDSLLEKITSEYNPIETNQEFSSISKFLLPFFKKSKESYFSFEEFKTYIIMKYHELFGQRKTLVLFFKEDCIPLKNLSKEDYNKVETEKIYDINLDQQIYTFMNSFTKTKNEFEDTKIGYQDSKIYPRTSFEKNFDKICRNWYKFSGDVVQHYLFFDVSDLNIDEQKFYTEINKIYSKACFYRKKSSILFYLRSKDSKKIYNEILKEFGKYKFQNTIFFNFTFLKYTTQLFKHGDRFLKRLNVSLTPKFVHYNHLNIHNRDSIISEKTFVPSSMDILKELTLVINGFEYYLGLIFNELSLNIIFKVLNIENSNLIAYYVLETIAEKDILYSNNIFKTITISDKIVGKEIYILRRKIVYDVNKEYDTRFLKTYRKKTLVIRFLEIVTNIFSDEKLNVTDLVVHKIFDILKD